MLLLALFAAAGIVTGAVGTYDSATDCRVAIRDGAALTVYSGHGNLYSWADEGILSVLAPRDRRRADSTRRRSISIPATRMIA